MSIALMTAAFKTALPSTQKFVLVALCDIANDQGECYPSIRLLMERCSLSERAVQESIASLEKLGCVRREFRTGRSTVYWLSTTPAVPAPPHVAHPRTTCTPHQMHPTPAVGAPPPPQLAHPTPARGAPITINEPSIEPSGKHQKARAPVLVAGLEGIDEQLLRDWKALRLAKKAPVTATAVAGIQREAVKAGLTLGEALAMSCERGWAGFKAEWLADRGGGAGMSKQAALEARNKAVADSFRGAI